MYSENKRLLGGHINKVYLEDGIVYKQYQPKKRVQEAYRDILFRSLREKMALERFKGTIAPIALGTRITQSPLNPDGVEELITMQSYIEGEVVQQTVNRNPELYPQMLKEAGQLLRKIHTPVKRNPEYLRNDFNRKIERVSVEAYPILEATGLEYVTICPDWEDVYTRGTTRVHRDFWLANVIKNGEMKAIDWEWSGIGSPYEDFSVLNTSVFWRKPEAAQYFWDGYNGTDPQATVPSPTNIRMYTKLKILQEFANMPVSHYLNDTPDYFYSRLTGILVHSEAIDRQLSYGNMAHY